jgi:putative alpha-1,2-mannosidase
VVTSKPVENFLLYDRGRKIKDNEKKGKYVKGFLEFETDEGEQVFFKMGVSTVSMKNALENLIHEIPHWNFEVVHNNAISEWNRELSKIKIKTKDIKKKKIFYTAMYHTMIAPNLYHDVNGEYRGTDKKSILRHNFYKLHLVFSLGYIQSGTSALYNNPSRKSE